MSHDRAFDRRAQPGTLGSEMRKLFQEMQGRIENLQEMLTYASAQGKTEIVKHLNNVLESFNELEKRYRSGEVMNDIKKASYMKASPAVDKTIEKIRSSLKAADKEMNEENTEAKAEMRDIRSLLKTSTEQVVNEHFIDFSSPRNKFVALVDKIDNFEKMHKTKNAKNTSQFFTSQPKANEEFPQNIPVAKFKSNK